LGHPGVASACAVEADWKISDERRIGSIKRNKHVINAGHVTLRGVRGRDGWQPGRRQRKQSEETTDATTVRATLTPNHWVNSAEFGSEILFNFSRLFILSMSTGTKLYSTALLPMITAARLLLVPHPLRLSYRLRVRNVPLNA